MKKEVINTFIILTLLVTQPIAVFAQNVGINDDGSSPDNSAILDLKSNNKGMLTPRLTGDEIKNISSPATGLIVYNIEEDLLLYYDGENWQKLRIDCWPEPTEAYAGENQEFHDETTSTTLTANTPQPNHGSGKWSIVSGTGGSFNDDTDPATIFTGTTNTAYTLKWTIATNCDSSSSNVNITFESIPATPDEISVVNNCGYSVLSRGTPPDGVTWYWQTSSSGTSTTNSNTDYTVTTSGTYYLRARNSSGYWSASCSSASVTVRTIPSSPTTTGAFRCGPGVVTLNAASSDGTIKWYTSSSGGTCINTGTSYSPSIASTTTFYVDVTNIEGCSSTRASVTGTVNAIPDTPSTPTCKDYSGYSILTRGAPPAGVTWYWQTSGSGTSTANSNTNYTVTTSGTYYLRARSNSGCWSAGSSSVDVNID